MFYLKMVETKEHILDFRFSFTKTMWSGDEDGPLYTISTYIIG